MSTGTTLVETAEEQEVERYTGREELELPETVFIRDIENRVFQAIVLRCLSKVEGIQLLEGNFIDSILGRDHFDGVRGIHAEQDSKSGTVSVKVEVNVCYGVPIPQKAEEIQEEVTRTLTELTGLPVSRVHVVFKNVILGDPTQPLGEEPVAVSDHVDEEYTEEF